MTRPRHIPPCAPPRRGRTRKAIRGRVRCPVALARPTAPARCASYALPRPASGALISVGPRNGWQWRSEAGYGWRAAHEAAGV